MKIFLPKLEMLRGRIFFWLGLAVLPVFWVWWMRPAYFSQRQRRAGWIWTACYVVLLIVFRDVLAHRFEFLSFAYPLVAFHITAGLSIWLLLRIARPSLWEIILFWFSFGGVFSHVPTAIMNACLAGRPSVGVFVLPTIVAGLHLLVEPARRCSNGIKMCLNKA